MVGISSVTIHAAATQAQVANTDVAASEGTQDSAETAQADRKSVV